MTALTGVNLYAASFLIPLSVVFYTAQGGIMAAFLSSWGHVGIIYIAMLIFVWKVYTGPSDLGSTDRVMMPLSMYTSHGPTVTVTVAVTRDP